MGAPVSQAPTSPQLQAALEDLRAANAPQAVIEATIAKLTPQIRAEPGPLEIIADNVVAVRVFDAMTTQWNVVSLTTLDQARIVRLGLRYEVLDVVARGLELAVSAEDFRRIRFLEAEALVAWSEAAPR